IMSIGACYFDPATGEIGDTFHEQVDISSNGHIDAPTVLWWMKQSDEARAKFANNDKAEPIKRVLAMFTLFVKPDSQVWGNGIAFDNVIIRNAYSVAPPWKYWNDRDVRTIVELGKVVGIDPKRDVPFNGVKHDALADAIHQAKYVSVIWQALTGPYL
ncbi:MAG: 3'-5' exonuclease, partial [Shewanella sp.]